MMHEFLTPRVYKVGVLIAATLIIVSFIIAGVALIERFDQTNQRREQQANFNERLIDSHVQFLCFFKTFVIVNTDHPLSKIEQGRIDRFFAGSLKAVGASPTACETHPGNPN